MPTIYDENPNQLSGGDGCLFVGENGSADCDGLYAEFEAKVFSQVSPRPAICEYHAKALVAEFDRARAKGTVQRLPGRSKYSRIPDDPRRKQRPAVTDQPDSPTLTQAQLAEAIKPPKRRGKAKPAPAAPALVKPAADDTPDI